MPRPSRFARYSFAHLIVLSIALTCLTSWATFTGYTAKQNKSSDRFSKEKTSDRVSGAGAVNEDSSVRRAKLNKAYGNLPLSFEANRGQTDSSVNYVARGPGYNIFLTPGEAVLTFQNSGKDSKEAAVQPEDADEGFAIGPTSHQNRIEREGVLKQDATAHKPAVVKMRFDGANTSARAVEGVEELPGKVNYLFGSDSSKWLTSIPTYGKVAYRNAYPGVDVVYYGTRRQLEYDLVVAPGADPSVVTVKYEGVKDLSVDRDGNLVLKTEAGELQQQKPVVYQEENGARKLIEGRYVMRGRNKIGFKVSSYNRNGPLVIDPILSYSSFVNSSGDGYSIAVDPSGFAYITGSVVIDPSVGNLDLPPTPGAYQTISGGGSDVFVTKINQEGNGAIYSTFLGGNGDDAGYAIAVDSAGNAYVTGSASGTFPTTAGAIQPTRNSSFDAFVTKLNATGSGLIYSTFLGGNEYDDGDGIAVDSSGNAYVVGQTFSTNLATTPGVVRPNSSGGSDNFIAKLNSAGTGLFYLTYFGGGGFDFGLSVALDAPGNAYTTGQTSSLNLPQVNGLQPPGGLDRGFFRSTDAGNNYVLRRRGLNDSYVYAIAVDPITPTTIFAGTNGGVYKSTDGSGSWTQAPVAGGPRGTIRALLTNSGAPSTVYAGGSSGVFKSTDGGNTWVAVNNGLTVTITGGGLIAPNVNALASIAGAPNTIYAACNGGVFKSTDGGANWILSSTGLLGSNVNTVVIDPTNPQLVYAGTLAGVSKSTNGGANWTAINTGLTTTNSRSINTIAIDPSNSATLYAATQGGVYKTTTSGSSWGVVNNGLLQPQSDGNFRSNPPIRSLVISPSSPNTIYAGVRGAFFFNGVVGLTTVFTTTDGGANWTAIRNGFGNFNSVWSLALDPSNPATVYAGTLGDTDAYLAKVNGNGTALTYSTYLGGSRSDYGRSVAVDASESAYVSGFTQGPGFPLTSGVVQTVSKGDSDIFLTKFDPSGSTRIFSTLLGGSSHEDSYGLAIDTGGNAYVTGSTYSTDFPVTPGAFQSKLGGVGQTFSDDAFVAKVNPSGSALLYSSYLGGSGSEPDGTIAPLNTIGVDALGNAYLLGTTSDDSTFPAFDFAKDFRAGVGSSATYLAKVEATTSSFSITGRLTTASNAPIAGVLVEVTNSQGLVRSSSSDSLGYYAIISLPAGDYTVKPGRFGSFGHYLFAPPTRTFVGLNSDQTADFTGTQVYDIQGQVTSSTVPGVGIFDVTVTLSGSASASTITDANGNYAFQDLVTGNYTVTPSKTGFTFNPANLTFTNLSVDQFGADFTTASATFFTVSGRVADAGNTNTGIANVVISTTVTSMRGFRKQSTQTDANGNYSIPNLQAGGNYSFVAALPILSFTPQNPIFNNLSSNQTLNFLAAPVTGLIGKIAFGRSDQFSSGISVINADGTGEVNVTNNFDEFPTWSPDGLKIAFARQDSGNSNADIYVMNGDGSGVTRLTNAPLQDVIPAWSPDGTKLTFTYGDCNGSGGTPPDVFVMDANGANRTKLTNNFVVDGFSDWSPGGSTIAFARGPLADCNTAEEQGDIYAMNPDGSNQRVLANTSDGESRPAYSPDGSKIAYLRGTASSAGAALYVMNSDGTGQVKISPDLDIGDTGRPTWSPDGKKIAFAAGLFGQFNQSGDHSQIFVINADGTGLAQITGGTQNGFDPSWQHYSISGRVTGNTIGLPITMALAGTLTRVTQTDANGNYVFGNLAPEGNYSVSPVSTAFGFNPAKIDINSLVGNQIANFAVLPQVIPTATPPLADNFSGAQRDPAKWNLGTQTQPLGAFDPEVSVVQQNGQLVLTPRSNAQGLHYNGYVSVNSFDFNNATATVKVAQTASNGADTIFAIGSDLDNFFRFVVHSGGGPSSVVTNSKGANGPGEPLDTTTAAQLIIQVKVNGQLASFPILYDPIQDFQFMRFRHEPPTNSIVFETGPDDSHFTERHRVVLQKGVNALTCELSAGTSSSTTPGQAKFDDFQLVTNTFQFSAPAFTIGEGDGSAQITVTRAGSTTTAATVNYTTADDTAVDGTNYIKTAGTLTFAAGESVKTFAVTIVDNVLAEGDRTLNLLLSTSVGSGLNSPGRAVLKIVDNDTVQAAQIQFNADSQRVNVNEGAGSVTLTVTRTGNTSQPATIDYQTADTDTFTVGCADTVNNLGGAYARCDFATAVGTLSFAAGEGSKTITVPIIDDAIFEGPETFQVKLTNAVGATLGSAVTATVTIIDNDTVNGPNPILQGDNAGIAFFVRQHYLDFLAREPEAGEPWSAILRPPPAPPGCANQFNVDPANPSAGCDRLFVSGQFFGSPEFKFKGGYVIIFYRVAFNRLPAYAEFANDLASVSGATAAEVFAKRAVFANNFVLRPEFAARAAMTTTDYVNALMGRYGLSSITTPDPANPEGSVKVTLSSAQMIAALNGATLTRAQVLRAIVQSDEVVNREALNVFISSQYYGYLRRTPDTGGFNSWINYLTAHPTDFRTMVNGFMNSQEYRLRFGS